MNWIVIEAAGGLAIMPRPRGGEWLADDIRALRSAGVDLLVSALEPEEEAFLELTEEAEMCERFGIAFERFPILDRSIPPLDKASIQFVEKLAELVADGRRVAIHCRMGIGRSGLLCASTLSVLGLEPQEAFWRTATARGLQVPDTREQWDWVYAFHQRRTARSLEDFFD